MGRLNHLSFLYCFHYFIMTVQAVPGEIFPRRRNNMARKTVILLNFFIKGNIIKFNIFILLQWRKEKYFKLRSISIPAGYQ